MFGIWLLLVSKVFAFEVIYNEFDNLNQWENRAITFYYSHEGAPEALDEDATVDAIMASAEAWSQIQGSDINILLEDRIEPDPIDRDDNFNMIFWDPTWEDSDSDILALTGLWANEAGLVRGFDMRLREDKPWSLGNENSTFDFQNAMAHELGHALGLAHPEVPDATMYSQTGFGEISKRNLHWDDEEAIRYLYPPTSSKTMFGCTTLTGIASSTLWVPIALIAFFRRRQLT